MGRHTVTRLDGVGLHDPAPFFEPTADQERSDEFTQPASAEARRYELKQREPVELAAAKLRAESILYNEQQRMFGRNVGEVTGDLLVEALGLPAVRVRATGSPDEDQGGG